MDFKVTYLDGGLGAMNDRSGFLSDSDFVLRCQRTRRYKSQIREVVTTCRPGSKRKSTAGLDAPGYSSFDDNASANMSANMVNAAHAVAATGYQNSVYPYPTDNINGLSSYAAAAAAAAMPQNLFTAIDPNSRPFLAPENFLHYSRHALGTYYPEYHHPAAQYPSNGFLDHMTATRTAHCFPSAYTTDSTNINIAKENSDKLYACQISSANESKFIGTDSVMNNGRNFPKSCCDSYINNNSCNLMNSTSNHIQPLLGESKLNEMSNHRNINLSATPNDCLNVIKHKPGLPIIPNSSPSKNDHSIEAISTTSTSSSSPSILSAFSTTNNIDSRQSVLMWGTSNFANRNKYGLSSADIKPSERVVSCKWNGSIANPKPLSPHPSVAHSPSSGKVPMTMPIAGYGTPGYGGADVSPIEVISIEAFIFEFCTFMILF